MAFVHSIVYLSSMYTSLWRQSGSENVQSLCLPSALFGHNHLTAFVQSVCRYHVQIPLTKMIMAFFYYVQGFILEVLTLCYKDSMGQRVSIVSARSEKPWYSSWKKGGLRDPLKVIPSCFSLHRSTPRFLLRKPTLILCLVFIASTIKVT